MSTGKSVLVFGGSAGIGAAAARLLSSGGADVLALGRSEEKLRDLAAANPAIRIRKCDITVARDLEEVVAPLGCIDHVVVTAGTVARGRMAEIDLADFMLPFHERVASIVRIVQLAAPKMERGSFVFTSGTAAVSPEPEAGAAGAAVAALEHLSRTLLREFAPIRFNVVRPGFIMTDLVKAYGGSDWEQLAARMADGLPGKRPGSVDEAADAIRFLISNEFMNGVTLTIDGGGRWV